MYVELRGLTFGLASAVTQFDSTEIIHIAPAAGPVPSHEPLFRRFPATRVLNTGGQHQHCQEFHTCAKL